jgi:hypothetical protein
MSHVAAGAGAQAGPDEYRAFAVVLMMLDKLEHFFATTGNNRGRVTVFRHTTDSGAR